jgi:signal transduction histidine kinase
MYAITTLARQAQSLPDSGSPAAMEPAASLPVMHRTAARYFIAFAVTLLTAGLRLALLYLGVLDDAPYIIFALAVLVSAWIGGLGPGLFATFLSMAAAVILAIAGNTENLISIGGLTAFFLQGAVISYLAHTRLRAIESVRQAASELEQKVDRRTHALKVTNSRLAQEAIERERITTELQNLAQKLEASNRELQDFASIASHDLQEPLRKIQAFGDRLRARYWGPLGDEGRDYIRRMQDAAGRMQTLITDLLTLSRVSTKAQPFVEIDLAAIARDVLSDLETHIDQAGADVVLGNLPAIQADPTQIRQLLQNLIGNALKFRREGVPPRIVVDAVVEQPDLSDGGLGVPLLRLAIADNGIGFDEKYLDRIFTVFQRLHGRGTYEGTGVGLAVCRRIVERHGGTITAHSRPGQGSTFIVTLPVQHAGDSQ